ncbi:hypothetical protein LOC68_12810 [Blastopirellula sp. JC732]|uniref:TerB family tellurite resistance protein n=1 Tax=Blastopirellula sediminis TaxID=2894196 RepID=A0A9X1SGS0_9BACT|nr:hypothetical protein [Blastopirellula sediminis]MCC9607430.1 hypothetical protein [Blastopirellula sediminis]MCC9629277.1 hypothetical protein [Blastopirellula sediminis]
MTDRNEPNHLHHQETPSFRLLLDSMFVPKNQELWERLWEQIQEEEQIAELKKATGIKDDALLKHFVEIGVTADNLTAMALYPLMAVAWADGIMQVEEKAAILQAALDLHVEKGHASYDVLENWLDHPPQAKCMPVWQAYVRAIRDSLTPEQDKAFHDETIGRARKVADATGGILGRFGSRISDKEEKVLKELEAAFQ